VQSICKSPLSWVLRAIAGILMPLVFLSEQTIKCSVQGEPPARFHFNIGISQANYNSGSQEVPGEGICQPRCIGHWLWSSSMSEDQLFHAKAGAGASNTISSKCHVRVSSFEPSWQIIFHSSRVRCPNPLSSAPSFRLSLTELHYCSPTFLLSRKV